MENNIHKELYEKYLNGQKESFEILYNKYRNKITYFIYNIIKDYEKSEDIMQETFIYVMQNTLKENYSFKYYLYLIAKSKAINYLNKEKRRNSINEKYIYKEENVKEQDILELMEKEENKKEILEAIDMLEDKYKNAIYLVKIEELSYKEVANILGESIRKCKNIGT